MSTLISSFKETTQSLTAIRRPWRDFFDISAVDLPSSSSDATTRIAQNLTHFRLNYTVILLVILFLSLIYHPRSLLTFLVILLAWFFLYFARDREEPVVIFGFTIDDRLVIATLFCLTVAGLVLTGAWVNVLLAVAIGGSLVILHAALRSTDDLVMDDLESPYGHVLAARDEELDSPRGDYRASHGSFSSLLSYRLLKEIHEGLSERIMRDWLGKLLKESPCIQAEQLLVRVLHPELEATKIDVSAASACPQKRVSEAYSSETFLHLLKEKAINH